MPAMKTFALVALAATTASAHMLMRTPARFANTANNGPLVEDGSDYPCHMSGPYTTASGRTSMAPGSTQPLEFTGSAVHGGGSCQISITYDLEPTRQSVFKVIHSIEGGCPARNQVGNYANDPNLATPDTYEFTIPSDLPAGDATLSWTWFNLVGNREMYMNCAPITIEGSSADMTTYNALPDVMIANIPDDNNNVQCRVAEGNDAKFPNAGASVDNSAQKNLQDLSSQPGCSFNYIAGDAPATAPSPPTSVPVEEEAPVVEAPAVEAPVQDEPTATIPGGVFVTAPAEEVEVPVADPVTTAAPAPTVAPVTPPPVAAPASPSGGHAEGTACPQEGTFNCISGSAYQQCGSGAWSVPRAMAAGTACTPGESMNLAIFATIKKRDTKRAVAFRA